MPKQCEREFKFEAEHMHQINSELWEMNLNSSQSMFHLTATYLKKKRTQKKHKFRAIESPA